MFRAMSAFSTMPWPGLGGIRLVLLVVAADEGVKPQTREHLEICTLLEIPHAMVVLTKSDLVDSETLELAQLEVEELLEPTHFEGSAVFPVSSISGDGIADLRDAILAKARNIAVAAQPVPRFACPSTEHSSLKALGPL